MMVTTHLVQICPVCKIGGLSFLDTHCPQCKSELKVHHAINELDQKLKNKGAVSSVISFKKESFVIGAFLIALFFLGTVVMSTILFLKTQDFENKMISKINILNRKSDESLKSYREMQSFKTEINSSLSKTHGLIENLESESKMIGTNIVELKEQIASKITQRKKRPKK